MMTFLSFLPIIIDGILVLFSAILIIDHDRRVRKGEASDE